MGIFQGSRYEYSVVDFVSTSQDADANAVVFYSFDELGTFSYLEHTYIEGERLDSIAQRYYDRPDMWWTILDHNPDISDPDNIRPGKVLRIPNV
jgi:nucleoid-associated protein YgaU